MPHKLFENLQYNPTIYLFADPDCLGLSLVEHLLTNLCKVTVITSSVEEWNNKTQLLNSNNSFKIVSTEDNPNAFDLSYSIFVDVFLNRTKKEINKALELNENTLGKKFVLFPYQVESSEERKKLINTKSFFINKNIDVEYFFIGDIFGPNINQESYVYKLINYFKAGASVNSSNFIYPLLSKDIVKQISENLFSFGPLTNEVALIGKEIPIETFVYHLSRNELFTKRNNEIFETNRFKVGKFTEEIFEINFTYSIKETADWLEKNNIYKSLPVKKVAKKDIYKNNFVLPKFNLNLKPNHKLRIKLSVIKKFRIPSNGVFYGLYISVVILLLPFIIMLVSASSFILSLNSLQKGNSELSVVFSNISKQTSFISTTTLKNLSNIPVLGIIYKKPYLISSLIYDGNKIAERGLKLYGVVEGLPSKILGNDLYSISTISNDIYLEFDYLYKETSFLVSEIESLENPIKQTIYKYITKERINLLKEDLFFLRNISANLDEILGSKEKRTYLILFQNNMELRPTGGFIGSFALVTFEGGRMTDINVQDVYSADGQLKGHVDPPNPIKDYLGEGGWYLRDANWDPDFTSSANKIEWFLKKEIDQKVDGVFAIDLELIKELIKVTGPIHLNDFNKDIDYKNIYEVTQFEVEDNFFPGSRNKSNFLTALSTELITTLVNNEKINNLDIASVFINGLREKHIQLYFHNKKVQTEISKFSFDGGVVPKNCAGNCFYNFVSYIDANVGINKANYFTNRTSNLDIFVSENVITNILKITIKNDANPVLGEKVRYKSYLRALGLPGSNFEKVKVTAYDQENVSNPEIEVLPNYKSAGTLVEVFPGEEKTIEFTWTNEIIGKIDFSNKGQLSTYFRKQAGTVNDRLTINMFLPNYLNINENNFFTLTGQGSYVYNTLLTRDVIPLIYW